MLSNIFEIPTNLYPRQRSRSTSLSTSGFNWQGPAGQYLGNILSNTNPAALVPVTGSRSVSGSGFNWQGPAGGYLSRFLASTSPSALIPVTESRSTSHAGINWESPVASSLLPQLLSTAKQLPDIAENLGETLQGQYSNIMRQALGPEAFQGALTSLANRGLLDSSIADTTLANAASTIARNIANQAYTSALQAERAKMEVPSLLAGLVEIGKESTSGTTSKSTDPTRLLGALEGLGRSTSSQSLSKSTDPTRLLSTLAGLGKRTESWQKNEAFNENPLAPYQLMANILV